LFLLSEVLLNRQEETPSLPTLSIVVPCYNEEAILPEAARRFNDLLNELMSIGSIAEGFLSFVDDGSEDNTWQIIASLAAENSRIRGIKLSRNRGHQIALLAGLLNTNGDLIISIDADLQDDLAAVKDMLAAHAAGAEIVYAARRQRQTDTRFKRITAEGYYSLLRIMGVQLIFNHADYRLLTRRVVEELRGFKETNVFLRGLIPQLGFNSAVVYYDRQKRLAGESKYSLSKMLALAVEGITSFSDIPLKIITVLGLLISFLSFCMAAWALWIRVTNPAAVPGWASIVIPVYMLGGVQLLSMGVIGQYLVKIYFETKSRPRFIIEKTT
jgi:polyisoprenyl-phosphate glycosyltransferase